MRVKVHADLISGMIFLTFSIFLIWVIPSQIRVVTTEAVNSRTFPYLLAFLIMVMSVKTILVEIVKIIRKIPSEKKEFDLIIEAKALLLFIILITYLILMPIVGYLISSILMVLAFLLFFKTRKWYYYAVVLGITVAVFMIFRFGLNVQLL